MLPTRLFGARTHNLRGIDLEVRPGEVLVLTGVSGSGKSSLAQDTLYAEGQRRFVESFSPYARQFLERLQRPPMDALAPVAAGVSVDRSAPAKSSRSTVATMADLEAYLAGLFATESVVYCPDHHIQAAQTDLETATARVLGQFHERPVLITAPLLVGSAEEYLGQREDLLREGYLRVICASKVFELGELKPSLALKEGRVYVVLDRLRVCAAYKSRITEAVEVAFRRSAGMLHTGQCWVFDADKEQVPLQLRQGLACPVCARGFHPPRPGYFSYESPLGACGNCKGFGRVMGLDLDKVIPDDRLSLADGAVRPWRGPKTAWERAQLKKYCDAQKIDWNAPWTDLSEAQRELVLNGTGKRGRTNYWGLREWFRWLESKAYKMHVRVFLARYRAYDPCPECRGARLMESSRSYKWAELDLGEWHRLQVDEALHLLESITCKSAHGKILSHELSSRLRYLSRVGLGYLTLDRQARTLSGGESQRVTLTAALGTSLHNALFVLDEPTVGLHPADIGPLNELISELASRNNAVIVIEHEPLIIENADRVVELGPAAGELGGTIVFDGTVAEAKKFGTATSRALRGPQLLAEPVKASGAQLTIVGASANNLKNVDLGIPLGQLVAVSGPSGSGKTSLIVDVLYKSVARFLGEMDVERPGAHVEVRGMHHVKFVELVDQSPLGRTSRGNSATYTKAWDAIRKGFAGEPQAANLGYDASHFSFNVAGGRCETCSGEGHETVEMQFLADVSLICPVCSGRRFKDEILAVLHRGHSISDVLELTVTDAVRVFADSAPVRRALAPLVSLGLGYVKLGQPLSTLSGGEAQRLKLARALAAPKPGTLYVLDEPSAGLHADEITHLVQALRVLVRSGGTVVFVDHDLSLLACADWVVELGPGGGRRGGNLEFSGTAADLLRAETVTGRALALAKRVADAPPKKPKRARVVPAAQVLTVRGAREHTLKNVSVEIPHQKLTVVTGPSGSGKSTLAFDVVFAEGQRRFLETLTPYARRYLPALPRPQVDAVFGVPPAIALEQRTTRVGSRSTVATVTEVAHYLRLAFAKLGKPYCPDHDQVIARSTAEEILSVIIREKGKGKVLAPVVTGRKGSYVDVFTSASRAGYQWAVADGHRVSTDSPPRLAKTKEHDIDVILQEDISFRAVNLDQVREALRWGRGALGLQVGDTRKVLSTGGVCTVCGFSSGEIDPRLFSFNTVQGQCAACEGTGLVPQKETRGAKKLEEVRRICGECGGARLGKFPRRVRWNEQTYPSLTALGVKELRLLLASFKFDARDQVLAEPIMRELLRRLEFLGEVGLDYLSLDRDAASLSGGELQRLRLAAQLGADLTGALYVLDEPTIGLHPRDTQNLLKNLRKLVDTGSTVLMVEHDEEAIRAADHLIDMGPLGGKNGGYVVCSGSSKKVLSAKNSPTAKAFAAPPKVRELTPLSTEFLTLKGACDHNLKGDELRIPVGALSVVAGVSGSGKSTLIRQVLLKKVQTQLAGSSKARVGAQDVGGLLPIKRALAVDQSPIGRTPRSIPATFLGIFDIIRQIFAKTPDAQVRGFDASRFSFNTKGGGRCPACEGQGALSHEMSFLPDAVTTCFTCDGTRFEDRTLEVKYRDHSIGDVLALSAEEAVTVFAAHPKIARPLQVLTDLGAGYIALGQGSHTLSGGEAQRLKLAAELSAGARHEPTLYVLDEPTTGLHLSDVSRLIDVLSRLVLRGDTLVVIEHQPDVIRAADWVVELGPGGGPDGGRIVFQGPARELRTMRTATADVLNRIASA